MRKQIGSWVAPWLALVVVAACDTPTEQPAVGAREEALYDCHDPAQRFTCAPPSNANKRFICHATGSGNNPYNKLSVPWTSAHAPGVAHGNHAPDQAPGASGLDVGAGAGLDCDCNPRVCASVCTGADDGTSCDDDDRCTGDGACEGDACTSGPPRCVAGEPVDACNVQSGACDGETGACGLAPRPAGTPCGERFVCDGAGACVGVPRVTINEIESSGGVPGDWVELVNTGTAAANVSGWRFLDNDDTHTAYQVPAGTTIAVGGTLVLEEAAFGFGLGGADSARLFDAGGAPVDAYAWTAHAPSTYGRCPDGTGAFRATTRITKGAANDCSVAVVINEIESSGGVPGDWVELYNHGAVAVDISGWVFKDSGEVGYSIPTGTTLAAGAFYLLEEAAFGFGLGGADSARLFDAGGAAINAHAWTTHATATTYGRCPNGTGALVTTGSVTKGAANACGGGEPPPGPPPGEPWPGPNSVGTVDEAGVLGMNTSDLFYEAGAAGPDLLWAVRNAPSTLHRLVWNGSTWTPSAGWEAGKALRYPSGTGDPDAEGVTRAEAGSSEMYVATERDNLVSGVSRLSILRFDAAAPGAVLAATHEWNLTANLPAVGPNLGLEAITWIPDDTLVAAGFFDEAAGRAYAPADYPDHGGGLFFVGIEANGTVYAYALHHASGGFTRVATLASGHTNVMSLWFDREVGYLWAHCDDTCGNQSTVLTVGATGRFALRRRLARPSTLPNGNHEGITMAPEAQCTAGQKRFFWTDDSATGGHALRADTVPCGAFVP